jgi:site-specific recombinase XerC
VQTKLDLKSGLPRDQFRWASDNIALILISPQPIIQDQRARLGSKITGPRFIPNLGHGGDCRRPCFGTPLPFGSFNPNELGLGGALSHDLQDSLLPDCHWAMNYYRPRHITADRWERIRPLVEDVAALTSPKCAYTEERLLVVCARYVDWAVNQCGYPLRAKALFRRQLIGLYFADRDNHLSVTTKRNYRSLLLRVSEIILPEAQQVRMKPLNTRQEVYPYTENEMADLRTWAIGQGTRERERSAKLLLALSAGAGLWSSEIAHLKKRDIQIDGQGILISVRGEHARQVPVLAEWETWLRLAVEPVLNDDDYVFRSAQRGVSKNLVTGFVSASNRNPDTPAPRTNRLRATWLVTHLAARTDMRALMRAAAVEKFENLARLLRHVPELDNSEYRAELRKAVR